MQGQSGTCLAQLQSYLDEFAQLQTDRRINDWVQTDVANLVDDIGIVRFEIDEVSHESILFLEKSIIHIRPDNKQISHYPKICFIALLKIRGITQKKTTYSELNYFR